MEEEAWQGELGERGRGGVAVQIEVKESNGEACEEEGRAPGEAEGAGGQEGQEVDEDGEPDRELDGVLGVAEEPCEVKLALEPAQEGLDLPGPEVDLDDLGSGEVPAIGDDLVAARGRRAVAGLGARGDVGGDQAQPPQDGAGVVVGAAEGDPLVGDDGDPSASGLGEGRLDRAVRLDGDGRLRVEAGDQVDAGREQALEADVAVGAEIDDEGLPDQGRQTDRVAQDRPVPGLAVVELDRGQVNHLGQVQARDQPALDPHPRDLRAAQRRQPAGQPQAQPQEGRILNHQRPEQGVGGRRRPPTGLADPGGQVADDAHQQRRRAGAVRGRHLRVADPQPLRAVRDPQPLAATSPGQAANCS